MRIDAGALSHPEAVNVELEAEGFNPRSVVASLALKESATTANRASPEVASTSSAPATGAEEGAEEADTNGGFLGSLPTGLQQLLSKSSAPEATARETTPADLAPLATTIGKVLGGVFLLAQGNLLVLGGVYWMYSQHKKAQAAQEDA